MRSVLIAVFAAWLFLPSTATMANENGPSPEDVAFVQGLLVRFGYDPGPVDGICGDRTAAAVRAFHDDRDLPLEPGDVKPQAATIAKNLMTTLTDSVVSPNVSTPKVYQDALGGNAEAAMAVGEMYVRGDNVAADKMLAYAWWTVAETYGNAQAGKLKADLVQAGQLSAHEQQFASALAKTICAPHEHNNPLEPVQDSQDDSAQERGDVTM